MENDDKIIMSRIAFERMQSKDEKNDTWRNVIIIILIVLLVVTNAMWLVAWNQYDYVDEYTEVDSGYGGDANYIGNNGDINYGTNSTQNEIENAQ